MFKASSSLQQEDCCKIRFRLVDNSVSGHLSLHTVRSCSQKPRRKKDFNIWWCQFEIPTLGRLKQEDREIWGQVKLHSKILFKKQKQKPKPNQAATNQSTNQPNKNPKATDLNNVYQCSICFWTNFLLKKKKKLTSFLLPCKNYFLR